MTVTKDQAQMLATLACASRPTGARQWKHDDVMAEIAKVSGRSLPAVICAVTRAAMDRNAQRPSVIASAGSHWGDTMLATDWTPNFVDRVDRCSVCSHTETVCRMRWAGDHDFRSVAVAAKEAEAGTNVATAAVIVALKDELALAPPREPAPGGLEDMADRNPKLRARVDALRAVLPPGPPMRESGPVESEAAEAVGSEGA
jgi:hypothetical protein